MTITLRSEKGSELTYTEMDGNFQAVRERELAFFISGGADDNETVWAFRFTRPMSVPADLDGSQFTAVGTTAALEIHKNGTTVGTLTLAANAVTVDFDNEQSFAAGDIISIVSDGAATFTYLAATFRAFLT